MIGRIPTTVLFFSYMYGGNAHQAILKVSLHNGRHIVETSKEKIWSKSDGKTIAVKMLLNISFASWYYDHFSSSFMFNLFKKDLKYWFNYSPNHLLIYFSP